MANFNKLIDLDLLEEYGKKTTVPLVGAVANLSQSLQGMEEELEGQSIQTISREDFEALSQEEKNNGTVYFISDEQNHSSSSSITLSTTDLTAGTSALSPGSIYLVYET